MTSSPSEPRIASGGGTRPTRRPGIELVLGFVVVAYALLYAGWYAFRWGGPDVELAIADGSFVPLGMLGIGSALLAARRARMRAARRAWTIIGIAFGAYCLGDISWFWLEVVAGEPPYPSIADAAYLAFYPILLVGLLALPRERPANPFRALLDVAIVVVGAGTVVWWLVLEPVAAATGSEPLTTLVALAYPVGDLLVVFALAATVMSRLLVTSRAALVMLGMGLVLNVLGDLSYARLSLEETYESGAWIDAAYLAGWVLMALGALVQAHGARASARANRVQTSVSPIPVLPYLAVGAVYAALAIATEMQGSSLRVVVGGAITVTLLVVVRQVLTARENARLLADRASMRSAARFQAIIQNANDVIAVVDSAGTVGFVTPSVARLVDRPAEAVRGQRLDTLVEPDDAPLVLELLRSAAARPGTGDTIQCRLRVSSATARFAELNITNLLEDPVVEGLVVTMRDVTERRTFEEQLRDQAFHDPLTGLANRALLADRIEHALRRSRRGGGVPALLYLDIDDFKWINDTLGHPIGDQVLVEVARRIEGALRAGDTTARLGGDEFAILVDDSRSIDEAVIIADRVLADLRAPIDVGATSLAVQASIGIVRPTGRSAEPSDLLRDADIAMYEAKREARGGYRVFEPAMFDATVERVSLEADLRNALTAGQLELAYQPLFDLATKELTGVEALLRWSHPVRGLVMPLQFIPLAERTGEIVPIGRWVIEQTCGTVRGWNALAGARPLRANVNVSARQLEPQLVDDVAAILHRTGFPAELLVLEITESVFAADRPGVFEILSSLRALGVRISIDDFGTGYSSLSVLRDLPVDELKIDRSFIDGLRDQGDSGLVQAIIKLSHDFNLATVAEGIEVVEQEASLRALGCDAGQGYLLGRPGSEAAMEARIREGLTRTSAA